MVVYADILVILNLLVDYFLILAVCSIRHIKISVIRQLFSALLGGISSLYIFAPDYGTTVNLLYQITVGAVMTLCAFGFKTLKNFLKSWGLLIAVTCGYAGLMAAVWNIFKPTGMTVVNSVVYFDISPAVLIGASVISYIVFFVLSAIFSKTAEVAKRCKVTVKAGNKSITMEGIIDTGNSINDVFGNSEVIITDGKFVRNLLGDITPSTDGLKARYRIMPCTTVSGGDNLDGFRCDSAVVFDGKQTVNLNKPILAVSKTELSEDYQAIINPRIFM